MKPIIAKYFVVISSILLLAANDSLELEDTVVIDKEQPSISPKPTATSHGYVTQDLDDGVISDKGQSPILPKPTSTDGNVSLDLEDAVITDRGQWPTSPKPTSSDGNVSQNHGKPSILPKPTTSGGYVSQDLEDTINFDEEWQSVPPKPETHDSNDSLNLDDAVLIKSPMSNYITSGDNDSLDLNNTIINDGDVICLSYAISIHYPVYLTCSSISVITCLVAFVMYITIRRAINQEMHHWINWNFMASFILRDCMVIILIPLILNGIGIPKDNALRYFFYLLTYILIVNFYWAFVEGLWIYLGVIYPFDFQSFSNMKLKLILIGWVAPGVLTIIFATTTEVYTHVQTKRQNLSDFSKYEHPLEQPMYEAFIRGPIYLLLFVNLLMMIRVLKTIASQLRSTYGGRHDMEQLSMHRRLAKATIALVFLLGLFYIIPEILLPVLNQAEKYCAGEIVSIINDTMSSLQGSFVAIFYVLTNKEVLKHTQRRLTLPTDV